MKKVWKMFSALFLVGLLFTGCTPKEDKAENTGAIRCAHHRLRGAG